MTERDQGKEINADLASINSRISEEAPSPYSTFSSTPLLSGSGTRSTACLVPAQIGCSLATSTDLATQLSQLSNSNSRGQASLYAPLLQLQPQVTSTSVTESLSQALTRLQQPVLQTPSVVQQPTMSSNIQAQAALALLAHSQANNYSARLSQVPYHASILPGVSLRQSTLLEQSASAAKNSQTFDFQSSLTHAHLCQRLSSASHRNSSILPSFTTESQAQLLIQKLTQENMIKDQTIAVLLSELQKVKQHASSSTSTFGTKSFSDDEMELAATPSPAGIATVASTVANSPQGQTSSLNVSNDIASLTSMLNTKNVDAVASYYGIVPNGYLHTPKNEPKKTATRWMIRYEELKHFQQQYGHCRVPHGYSDNPKLSWWVMNQRSQYTLHTQGKKNWLSEHRMGLLNAMGFEWKPAVGKPCTKK